MKEKTGTATSEFWLTLTTQIFTLVLMVGMMVLIGTGAITVDQAMTLAPILGAAIIGANAGSGAYSISRGLKKQGDGVISER